MYFNDNSDEIKLYPCCKQHFLRIAENFQQNQNQVIDFLNVDNIV
jgi:hypothetical protein